MVVDRHERQATSPRERLRSRHADEQRPDQPRPGRDCDRADVVEGRPRSCERLFEHRRDELEVPPARNLGHDTAELGMELVLGRDHAGHNLAVRGDECRGSLVAGRLDP